MKYYINKTITANFDQAIELAKEAFKKKGVYNASRI